MFFNFQVYFLGIVQAHYRLHSRMFNGHWWNWCPFQIYFIYGFIYLLFISARAIIVLLAIIVLNKLYKFTTYRLQLIVLEDNAQNNETSLSVCIVYCPLVAWRTCESIYNCVV